MTRNQWNSEEISYLRQNYNKMRIKDLAEQLGRSYTAVRTYAHRIGLTSLLRTGTASIKADYFDRIDSHEKAYVLGLLTADGNVRSDKDRLTLKLLAKDTWAVEFVRDQIAPAAPLREETAASGNTLRVFSVQSTPLVQGLADLGVTPRKSLKIEWPERLPCQFVNSYVCGYFDGDGSLGKQGKYPRWTIVSGSRSFLATMIMEIDTHTDIRVGGPYAQRGQNVWSIVKTGEGVRVIDQWIHRNIAGLPRKRLL